MMMMSLFEVGRWARRGARGGLSLGREWAVGRKACWCCLFEQVVWRRCLDGDFPRGYWGSCSELRDRDSVWSEDDWWFCVLNDERKEISTCFLLISFGKSRRLLENTQLEWVRNYGWLYFELPLELSWRYWKIRELVTCGYLPPRLSFDHQPIQSTAHLRRLETARARNNHLLGGRHQSIQYLEGTNESIVNVWCLNAKYYRMDLASIPIKTIHPLHLDTKSRDLIHRSIST